MDESSPFSLILFEMAQAQVSSICGLHREQLSTSFVETATVRRKAFAASRLRFPCDSQSAERITQNIWRKWRTRVRVPSTDVPPKA